MGAGGSALVLQGSVVFAVPSGTVVGPEETASADSGGSAPSSLNRLDGPDDSEPSSSSALRFFAFKTRDETTSSDFARSPVSGDGAALRRKTGARNPGAPAYCLIQG